MAHENLQQKTTPAPQHSRDIDPNVRQRIASNPQASVWVNASAGTGKTKVLTDRVLRLLLPGDHAENGTAPHKILCLTFTKAGASEMALRIHETLGEWAVMPDDALQEKLYLLLSRTITQDDIEAARRLFAKVIDTAGGLKIMTIHSFCQSVLSRFPLEAGLPPSFTVLEDAEARTLLERAKNAALRMEESENPLNAALSHIAATVNEQQFNTLLQTLLAERGQLKDIVKKYFDAAGVYTKLCDVLGIVPGTMIEEIIAKACEDCSFDTAALRDIAQHMIAHDSKTYQKKAASIAHWLSLDAQARQGGLESYMRAFFTTEGAQRKKLAGTKTPADMQNTLALEAQRLETLRETIKALQSAALTRDLVALGTVILTRYEEIKMQRAALDFDDLIYKTETLLHKDGGAAWVMYKLDQGIDHILVDEAQDTNPQQWRIIDALSDAFFDNAYNKQHINTVFAVGDQKQSIYSFQRASPQEFATMKHKFSEKIETAKLEWAPVDLNISFRSTPSILRAVDSVFASDNARKGLGEERIEHISFRRRQAGHVELWPIFAAEEQPAYDPWQPPVDIVETKSPSMQTASHIAQTIKAWLTDEVILPSYDRPIQPGDIMLLVRTRTAFVNQLMRALKALDIPVSGVDRMVLSAQLPIEDLIAALSFALLPEDDLNLACLLKSPLIGFDEETLYALSIDRKASLWQSLQDSTHKNIVQYLNLLVSAAKTQRPFSFFSSLLQKPCPADSVSGLRAFKSRLGPDCVDPFEEFLNAALAYEKHETPSLQHFLSWHQKNEADIKRELSEHTGQVRIMTVHGSKGLQAPIVILPDTVHGQSRTKDRFLWPDKTGLDVPLWSPRKDTDTGLFKECAAQIKQQDEEEYRRLLYVAMTRAEEKLYIAGYNNRKTMPENCWYELVRTGLEKLEDTHVSDSGALCLSNPQIGAPDRRENTETQSTQKITLPTWVTQPAPTEPSPPRPLMPSRPAGQNGEDTLAPLQCGKTQQTHNKRFLRGNITHRLLELLPAISAAKRSDAGQALLKTYSDSIDQETQSEILASVLNILDDPEFAMLFSEHAQAEVPISGFINQDTLISGQIDRLLVTDTDIWIVDYKTGRKIPDKPEAIPRAYKNQLKAYADTLSAIYPDHRMHCALLWTDGPVFMPVDIA